MQTFDVIIIGAGASGLIAAREIAQTGKSVLILEARKRPGGRIHTFRDADFPFPVEGGAEFIHGKLPVTQKLLRQYRISFSRLRGDVWQKEQEDAEKDKAFVDEHHRVLAQKLHALKRDVPVGVFLQRHFSAKKFAGMREDVTRFVEGYESADIARFSTFTFREDWLQAEEWKQFRVTGGYGSLIDALVHDCRRSGSMLRFASPVRSITWKRHAVTIRCSSTEIYSARQVVITVPLGVLQQNKLRFSPSLPAKRIHALRQLGYGNVIKILLFFRNPFWQDKAIEKRLKARLKKLFFIFTTAPVPTWWTQYPESHALLTGWISGSKAKVMASRSDQALVNTALSSLATIFEMDIEALRKELQAARVMNWTKDPYTLGSYSFATVHADQHQKTLMTPVQDTLFFAGEHLMEPTGTVEAALKSGLSVAQRLL